MVVMCVVPVVCGGIGCGMVVVYVVVTCVVAYAVVVVWGGGNGDV